MLRSKKRRRRRDYSEQPSFSVKHAFTHLPRPFPDGFKRERVVSAKLRRREAPATPAPLRSRRIVTKVPAVYHGRSLKVVHPERSIVRKVFCRERQRREVPLPEAIRMKIARVMRQRGAAGVSLKLPPLCR